MSELDLGLKVAARRMLWRMGYTTRIDVALRAVGQRSADNTGRAATAPEAFTDLDVLGITLAGGYRLESTIADCKTTARGSTARMFWVRGVADFFDADSAFMIRETDVSGAAKQLSKRLGISALNSKDLARIEELHETDLPLDVMPLSMLFDRAATEQYLHAFTALDAKLKALRDYRDFDYWVAEEHRTLNGLLEVLGRSRRSLDPRNPLHLSLVLDCGWLYLLSLVQAIEHIRAAHVTDTDTGLAQYMFGGPAGLDEKRQLSSLLAQLRTQGAIPQQVHVDPLPTWYPRLLELVTRLHRRPGHLLTALRLLELTTFTTALKQRVNTVTDTGTLWDAVAAKLAVDVVTFLVTTVGLDPGFTARTRSLLLGEDYTDPTSPAGRKTSAADVPGSSTTGPVDERTDPVEVVGGDGQASSPTLDLQIPPALDEPGRR